MVPDEEPPLRDQLVAARTEIIDKINELKFRGDKQGYRAGGAFQFTGLIAGFEDQLRDIDALLGIEDGPNA